MGDRAIRSAGEMIRRFVAIITALSLVWAAPSLAWWEYGHHTVASVAMANVKPQTAARIRQLLRAEAGLGTPDCRVRSLEDAAYWPDCIKRDNWRWGYTLSWHYQTEPVCKAYDAKANCAGGNCVSAQIERSRRILADRKLPAAQRLEALAFLAHFVGDIHMPLHSGDNFDQGGNGVEAQYGIAPGRNLHAVWDGLQAERAISSAQPPLVRRYAPAERARLSGGDPAVWGQESWELARKIYTQAFGFDPCNTAEAPKSVVWSDAAIEAMIPDAQARVAQGGLRLADMLDAALGG